MTKEYTKDDFEKFQNYGCHIADRMVYYGITGTADDGDGGVDFHATKMFIKNLILLDKHNQDTITVYINTPGGDWYQGMAIYDTIKGLRSDVIMIAHGYLMSMGTIIFQSADTRLLTPHCGIMIHNGSDGYIGDSKSFEAWGEESKYTRNKMYDIYYEKMKKNNKKITKKDIELMCSHDRIMRSKEAVKLGLADGILK